MLSKDLFGKIHVTPVHTGESVPVSITRKPETPNQYKLFMRPQEIMDNIKHSVDEMDVPKSVTETGDRDQIMSFLWNSKSKNLQFKSRQLLLNSIEDHGVMRPVTIQDVPGSPLTMGEGHHRVVASKAVEEKTGKPVFIPVVYSEDGGATNKEEHFPKSPEEQQFRNKELFGG